MCGGIPNSLNGEPLPKEPFYKVLIQLYREMFCGARWYDAHTRPTVTPPENPDV